MRYQQYKNKMLKIRKVIDFFYRFRFVFAGAITAIVAASITLDATRGNILETSEFKLSYTYGEEISYSGSAFMGNVTYEFRRKGETEWSEETPIYPGEYEARAKSQGSHGYKYSDESTFEIKPYEVVFKIKDDLINFGDDSPALTYELLPGDHLSENYIVEYADKTVKQTAASIKVDSLKIYNKDNLDVTSCYDILAIGRDIQFTPQKLVFTFKNPGSFSYTGDESHPFSGDDYDLKGDIFYDAHPVVTGGVRRFAVGSEKNHHNIAIMDDEGNDYTTNYQIVTTENTITVNKAAAITITSSSMEKTYDDQPFNANQFSISVNGLLNNIHEIVMDDVTYPNIDVRTCEEATNIPNTFTYRILDKRTHEEIDPLEFYQGVNINYGTINIKKVPITVTTPNITHTFDNKDVKGYKEGDEVVYSGTLVGDDFIKVDEYPTKNEPGKYSNDYLCHVYRQMMVNNVLQDVDVSKNYDIKYDKGNINIQVDPLVIKFDGRDLPYTAAPQIVYQNNNKGTIVSGSLPTGWTYSAVVYDNLSDLNTYTMTDVLANDKGYAATEEQVAMEIWDEYGNPMTQYYNIDHNSSHNNDANCDVTFIFEESKVTKVDLSVKVTDFDPIEYNHKTLEENLDLSSRVSSVGLRGDDKVVVSFSTESQKNIKDAKATAYSVGLNIQVINFITKQPAGGNYNISYNREEPITSSVKINRKNVTIHTPDIEMVYSDSKTIPTKDIKFDNVVVYDEYGNPIDDLKVSFNKNKTYDAPKETIGTRTYDSFEEEDIIITDKNTDEPLHDISQNLDNYNINLIEDGVVEITPRPIEIYQVDDESKDHIFYDGQYHGVYDGSLEIDYTHEDNNQEIGLLETKNHVLTFTKAKSKNTANADGDPTLYGDGIADKTAYYGTKILKDNNPDKEVTGNYDIQYIDSFIKINIIKKKIDITSGSNKKVFDGDEFDLYPEYNSGQWVDIKQMKASQFTFTIKRWDDLVGDYINASLDDGDVIQVQKTIPSVLTDSKNVGNHTNEFVWRIIDSNGLEKDRNFYNVKEHTGTLEVKKLFIDLGIDHREKEYDSNDITFPNGDDIYSHGYNEYQFNVTQDSRESGVFLEYRQVLDVDGMTPISFNQETFEKNFEVVSTINKGAYLKYYLATNMYGVDEPFEFQVNAYLYYFGTTISYTETSNVQLSFSSSTLYYRVNMVRIELQQTRITSTTELRIMFGTLRANDTLYFGTEKYTSQLGRKPRTWSSAFERSNVHIYRNNDFNDEVTDCYNIVM